MSTLYLVATPIGNLDDLTFRAQKILSEAHVILAEDTRVSQKLLHHYAIRTQMRPYHDFNKEKTAPAIIEALKQGIVHALISDAGTPGIADPAFYLVRLAIRAQIPVVPIPGPVACIAALIGSGLPTDRFIFENFLPSNSAKRRRIFEGIRNEKRTVIFYETPHRISKVLHEMDEVLGDVTIVIARELTKLFEEFLRGTPRSLTELFEKKKPRGEMVVMVNPGFQTRYGDSPPTGAATP